MINTYKVKSSRISLDGINDYIEVWFFGDIHRFTRSCDVDRWKLFLKRAGDDVKARPDRTFFVGMGDYDDFASTREKRELAHMHETTIEGFDDIDAKRCRILAMEMKCMRGRFLGMIEGNHHWVRSDGKTSTMDLCERLDAEYLGWLCHYTLTFEWGKSSSSSSSVHIVLCHGRAGGRRAGASINQVEDMKLIFPAADIYCYGHDHQRGAWPINVLLPVMSGGNGTEKTWRIRQKRQFLCRSGSFKKAYEDNTAGYEIGRLLKPADLGALKMKIGFRRNRKDGDAIITEIEAVI
jgi:hypothetical protein